MLPDGNTWKTLIFLSPSVRQRLAFPAALELEPASSSSSLANLSSIPPPFSSYWPFPLPPSPKLPRLVACFLQQPMGCQSACADSNGGSGQRLGARFGGRVEKGKEEKKKNNQPTTTTKTPRARRRLWKAFEAEGRAVAAGQGAPLAWSSILSPAVLGWVWGHAPGAGNGTGPGLKKQRSPLPGLPYRASPGGFD